MPVDMLASASSSPSTQLPSFVVCPHCAGKLVPHGTDVVCAACATRFPVRDGIPRLLARVDKDERQTQRVFDFEHARYQHSRRCHFTPDLVRQLLADLKLPPDYFQGKLVLDAGCGSGRWSYALAHLGARVIAVDLTDAGVRATADALRPFPHCHVFQSNVEALPFEPSSFDLVISWGVLHHTPDTRRAFMRLAPLVKPGGVFYVMVYERLAWSRTALTSAVRWLLRQLLDERRYQICRHFVIENPHLHLLLSRWLKVYLADPAAGTEDIRTLQFDAYDAYSPRYNSQHTKDEVLSWFREAGFEQLILTHPVKYTDRCLAARWGECGGAVHVRGVRRADEAVAPLPVVEVEPEEEPRAAEHPIAPAPLSACYRSPYLGLQLRYPTGWWVRRRLTSTKIQPATHHWPYRVAVQRHFGSRQHDLTGLTAFADRVGGGLSLPGGDSRVLGQWSWTNGRVHGLLREHHLRWLGGQMRARSIYFAVADRWYVMTGVTQWDAQVAVKHAMAQTLDAMAATLTLQRTSAAFDLAGRVAWHVARLVPRLA